MLLFAEDQAGQSVWQRIENKASPFVVRYLEPLTQPVESAMVEAMVGGDGDVTALVVVMLGVAAVVPDSAPALLEAMTLDGAMLAGELEEVGSRLLLA